MSQYTDLITSQHADKPKFVATVALSTDPFDNLQTMLGGLPQAFDLDDAQGAQLDVIGLWVGASRQVKTLLTGIYFSWDTSGVGWNQGIWRGPFDAIEGLTTLDDEPYRLLLRATIALNYWDGTMAPAVAAIAPLFPANSVYVQDNYDMSISIAVSGPVADPLSAALLTGGYLALRGTTVRINYYFPSTADSPVFGFDADNTFVGGWERGSWGARAPFAA